MNDLTTKLEELRKLAGQDRERPGRKYPFMTELTLLDECIALSKSPRPQPSSGLSADELNQLVYERMKEEHRKYGKYADGSGPDWAMSATMKIISELRSRGLLSATPPTRQANK